MYKNDVLTQCDKERLHVSVMDEMERSKLLNYSDSSDFKMDREKNQSLIYHFSISAAEVAKLDFFDGLNCNLILLQCVSLARKNLQLHTSEI